MHFLRPVLAASAVVALSLGLSPTAEATTGVTAVRAACSPSIEVGYTIKDGSYIKGSGSGNVCGNDSIRITLRRDRWYGPENLDQVDTSGAPTSVVFNCSGSGTFTYSTVVEYRTWTASGLGSTKVKTSNKLRVTC